MMISSEKLDVVVSNNDPNNINAAKPNKWNEQPHIGKYKLIKTIGKGNFAKVKLAQHVTTGKKVAVKVIDKTALNNSSLQKLFREVKIMKTLEHPNIVKLFEVIESERHVYLVMEYASKGEVFDFLVQNGRMKEKEARQRFREIVSAIQYCHQKNIVHRDLKAENLLLNIDLEIKIADFGFANNFDNKKQLDTFCGSPPYAAPELFQGRKYDGPEVDVWSLGVILYTLVSGSLPFDGHNMRELRERVLKGKYRIPFYMSTDCELLLKKMLIVSPQKRYTLLEVMKDKWINIGYEDSMLQPYNEPTKNYDDPVRLAIMENLGFSKDEVLDSLYNAKFNNVTATYLLLDHDVNNALENSSKSTSVSSLKNITCNIPPKDVLKANLIVNDKPVKTVARSGSAAEARGNAKVATNGDNKDQYFPAEKDNQLPTDNEELYDNENTLKLKSNKISNIKQSPSMGTTHIYSNDEVPPTTHASLRSRHNPIRIPGFQHNITLNVPKVSEEKTELDNDDKLLMPIQTNTWVKRNNTFTYADKNTSSEIESKPVTRTKHVMNMLSNQATSTVPLHLDQPVSICSNKLGSNEIIIKQSKAHDIKPFNATQLCDNLTKYDMMADDVTINVNGQPNATGDQLHMETHISEDDNPSILLPTEGEVTPCAPNQTPDTLSSINNSASSSKDPNNLYPQLNKPKQINSGSLFRSFTNKISSRPQPIQEPLISDTSSPYEPTEVSLHVRRHSTGDKLIRRLTSQNPQSHKNKRTSDYDATNSGDPWTPMETTVTSGDKRKISASSDLTGDKHSTIDKVNQTYTLKLNQSKPRLMHLVFRKNLTSKLRPDTIISEMLRSIYLMDEIEFKKVEQIDTFVIECQGRLKSENGGNELIHWEIEVFRLPRSSSFGIRMKKESGSSTRFKAILKILINRLTPVLCTNPQMTVSGN